MSNYHFGDDYDLNYYPPEASDGMGGVDWDKVERVEIEFDVYVKERTCKMEPTFINPQAFENVQEFTCTTCGRFAIVEQLGDDEDRPNYCPNCGCKVVGEWLRGDM